MLAGDRQAVEPQEVSFAGVDGSTERDEHLRHDTPILDLEDRLNARYRHHGDCRCKAVGTVVVGAVVRVQVTGLAIAAPDWVSAPLTLTV